MLKVEKVAQASAFLLWRLNSPVPSQKLLTLLYLADRRSLQQIASTITGDEYIAQVEGPMLKQMAVAVSGTKESLGPMWDQHIGITPEGLFYLKEEVTLASLDHLSECDTDTLAEVVNLYGSKEGIELQVVTQALCREWVRPENEQGSKPITLKSICVAVGYSEETASEINEHLQEMAAIDAYFTRN